VGYCWAPYGGRGEMKLCRIINNWHLIIYNIILKK
jgi:hypothetical protein